MYDTDMTLPLTYFIVFETQANRMTGCIIIIKSIAFSFRT